MNKHQLEGLLKARSEDLRNGRRVRNRRVMPETLAQPALAGAERRDDEAASRPCASCGGGIAPPRLRAMPRATRCLECQRAVEAALAPS